MSDISTKSISPADILSGAISGIAKSQADAPKRPLPQPKFRTEATAPVAAAQSEPAKEAAAAPEATSAAATINPKGGPLSSKASGSAFKRPVGVKTSSTPMEIGLNGGQTAVNVEADSKPAAEARGEVKSEVKAEVQAEVKAEVKTEAPVQQSKPVEAAQDKPVQATDKPASKGLAGIIQQATDKAAEKPAGGLRAARERASEGVKTGFDVKIALNTFKVYSPLVSALTFRPGKDSESVEISDAIRMMNAETEKLARALCELSSIDMLDPDKQWMVASFRTIASEHVGNEWKRCQDRKNFTADPYVEAFRKIASEMSAEPMKNDMPNMNDSTHIRLSVMKSMVPVIREYSMFENVVASMIPNYRIDRAEIFERTSEMLQEEARALVETFGIPVGDESFRISYQSMLNNCGSVMSSSVAYACDRMLDRLDAMPQPERMKLYEKAKAEGKAVLVDINEIREDFRSSMRALVGIANQAPQLYAMHANGNTKQRTFGK